MFKLLYPGDLPITGRRREIVEAIRASQVVVVAGETGSGKTTQLPKMCIEAGLCEAGMIGCTQPRRVAAMSISRRVADELGVVWGREVGCKMRFNDDTGADTRVKFMTDGILLAEIQSDPLLRKYSALIIDEAHERSLNIDFLLGYLNGLLARRPDLKLVITSATIDTEAFSKAFGGAPVVEVSGRLWPVEIRYRPTEDFRSVESNEPVGFVEAAVGAAEDALLESGNGDILIFMPTERDIREARELMEERLGRGVEVLGLYGRMPAADQQRIFAPGPRRRVVIATNVAETSLTLPRIRYVIDTGLARMSRYNPRTRTKRLPVEAVSQSSANQRSGRAGRLSEGVAIRLYAEEDFAKRPRFTQPEIQRANLAEVILRMKAFRLGEIETFPFLNPPQAVAIRSGYRLLNELGALDGANELTPLGRELARLPVDPTLGRMLLQARREKVLPEMLVIASGLSIPDPRERPEEQKAVAQAAHADFAHPRSDFLGLLKIWRASPQSDGRSGTNALRRFCKAHFLSFMRMREWRDVHRQLCEGFRADDPLGEKAPCSSEVPLSAKVSGAEAPASKTRTADQSDPLELLYDGVHRSILSGLLGQIAQREDRNRYKAAGSRLVTVFPGSHLFERQEPGKKRRPPPSPGTPQGRSSAEPKSRQPAWIMAAEIVETSQLFARSAAGIDPEWVVDLGGHLCEARYAEPAWNDRAQRVLVSKRIFLHGLEVSRRRVDYGAVDPVHATELFIRAALVQGGARVNLRFFSENQRLRDRVEAALTKVRHRQVYDLDEVVYKFYAARIHGVSSVHDLNRFVDLARRSDPDFCVMREGDLTEAMDSSFDQTQFPDSISLGNAVLPLVYAFNPGEETDGVTVQVPLPVASQLTPGQIQWMVPGLREEQISLLLRALPKSIRRPLMPLDVRASEVAAEFDPGRGDFLTALAEYLTRRYRIHVRRSDWAEQSLPMHLCPRVEVVDKAARPVAAGRDLAEIHRKIERHDHRSGTWHDVAAKWERSGLSSWSFGNLPEKVFVEEVGGAALHAFPGLEVAGESVNVRLFQRAEEADSASLVGINKLVEIALSRDLMGLRKELLNIARKLQSPRQGSTKVSGGFQQLGVQFGRLVPACSGEAFQESAMRRILENAFQWGPVRPLEASRFDAFVEQGRRRLPELVYKLGEWTRQIFEWKDALGSLPKRYSGMDADLERLVPADLHAHTPYDKLQHLPRYLKAVQIRAEKAVLTPAKDAERAAKLKVFAGWEKRVAGEQSEKFRWLLEELRVSLFAQELGTSESVSVERLRNIGGF